MMLLMSVGQMMRNSLWHTGNTDRQVNKNYFFLSWKTETTFYYCWRVKSSFKLVWMESASPCNSLKCRCCCSLVWSISLLTKTNFDPLKGTINVLNMRILAGISRTVCTIYPGFSRSFLDANIAVPYCHRVYRVPGFLSSRPNWLFSPPHLQASVAPPPLVPMEGHTRLRYRERGEPIRTKGLKV